MSKRAARPGLTRARARHGLIRHDTVGPDVPPRASWLVDGQARPVGPLSVPGQPEKHDLFSRLGRLEARFSKGRGREDGVGKRDCVEEAAPLEAGHTLDGRSGGGRRRVRSGGALGAEGGGAEG
jgi:hypothetical protein